MGPKINFKIHLNCTWMWKTTSLLLFHVWVGVMHCHLAQAETFLVARPFCTLIFNHFKMLHSRFKLQCLLVAAASEGGGGPDSDVCLAIWAVKWGGNRSKAEDCSSGHQSPACSRCTSQSGRASGPRIHQRGRGLTYRKMSSTLHTSGQIWAQCHWFAKHGSSPFKGIKRNRKHASRKFLPQLLFIFWQLVPPRKQRN